MKLIGKSLVIAMTVISLAACGNMSRTQKNTTAGAAIGGAAGYMIGGNAATTLGGAALGDLMSAAIFYCFSVAFSALGLRRLPMFFVSL